MTDATGYFSLVEPFWESVDIYNGGDAFLATFTPVPETSATLLAAHWCQSEVRNGGFHQFFMNPTGVLAPEALEAFTKLGRADLADRLKSAMAFFVAPYPRDQDTRCQALEALTGKTRREWDPFVDTDDAFYACLRRQTFEDSADAYARSVAS